MMGHKQKIKEFISNNRIRLIMLFMCLMLGSLLILLIGPVVMIETLVTLSLGIIITILISDMFKKTSH